MTTLAALKATTSLHDVATLLGYKPAGLAYLLYKIPTPLKYRSFTIPKSGGGTRLIKAPTEELKLLQTRLCELLQNCLDEINTGRPDHAAHGFRRHRSIITNAANHRNRRHVFNLDLENFFPTINFGRVRGFFIRNRSFALPDKVATIIAQIACIDGTLPQGSPCSPVVSNLICHILDMRLVRLAASERCTYSRYADDLTFSTNRTDFPNRIAEPSPGAPHSWIVGTELERQIVECGFAVNAAKVRMQYHDSRQEVTGLVVNKRINVRSEYRHAVRAMVHTLLQNGSFTVRGMSLDLLGNVVKADVPGTMHQLQGMLGFINGVDLENIRRAKLADTSGEKKPPSKRDKVYAEFLFFKEFYGTTKPVLLCEGKTDVVYLTHAIRSLVANFPRLAVKGADGRIGLNIHRFKSFHTAIGRVLGLEGGASHLARFIGRYKQSCERIAAPGLQSPVIIVFDNDDGGKDVFAVLKKAMGSKTPITTTGPFMHVTHNLYAISTPLAGGATSSRIEDCFDATTKAIQLGGKSFNSDDGYDKATQYGKADFAYKVVAPLAAKLDFKGFSDLLTNISAAIEDYEKRLATAVAGVIPAAAPPPPPAAVP